MSEYVKYFLFLLLGLMIGYFSYSSKEPIKTDEQFGVLRVPLLDGCADFDWKDQDIGASMLEVIKFDMKIKGVNTTSYLSIEHNNLPSDIMKKLSDTLTNCIPNKQTTYDNVSMLKQDIDYYLDLSRNKKVYAVFDNGKVTFKYNDKSK
jgi:hypothetical protein